MPPRWRVNYQTHKIWFHSPRGNMFFTRSPNINSSFKSSKTDDVWFTVAKILQKSDVKIYNFHFDHLITFRIFKTIQGEIIYNSMRYAKWQMKTSQNTSISSVQAWTFWLLHLKPMWVTVNCNQRKNSASKHQLLHIYKL